MRADLSMKCTDILILLWQRSPALQPRRPIAATYASQRSCVVDAVLLHSGPYLFAVATQGL
jgi:hypothetical protein